MKLGADLFEGFLVHVQFTVVLPLITTEEEEKT